MTELRPSAADNYRLSVVPDTAKGLPGSISGSPCFLQRLKLILPLGCNSKRSVACRSAAT